MAKVVDLGQVVATGGGISKKTYGPYQYQLGINSSDIAVLWQDADFTEEMTNFLNDAKASSLIVFRSTSNGGIDEKSSVFSGQIVPADKTYSLDYMVGAGWITASSQIQSPSETPMIHQTSPLSMAIYPQAIFGGLFLYAGGSIDQFISESHDIVFDVYTF